MAYGANAWNASSYHFAPYTVRVATYPHAVNAARVNARGARGDILAVV